MLPSVNVRSDNAMKRYDCLNASQTLHPCTPRHPTRVRRYTGDRALGIYLLRTGSDSCSDAAKVNRALPAFPTHPRHKHVV